MADRTPSPYYVIRRGKLLRQFDWVFRRIGRELARRYDTEFAQVVIEESRSRFARILPELPYIGGRKNPYTPIIVANGWIISLYQTMKSRGKAVEDVVGVLAKASDALLKSLPAFLLRATGKLALGGLVKAFVQRSASRSQKRRYSDDFVYRVVEGDGEEFDWGLELSQCAVIKLYEAQGVEELKPWCNFFDVISSRHLGMGLDANTTIGAGSETCRLLYKRGRPTTVPPPLKDLLEGRGQRL